MCLKIPCCHEMLHHIHGFTNMMTVQYIRHTSPVQATHQSSTYYSPVHSTHQSCAYNTPVQYMYHISTVHKTHQSSTCSRLVQYIQHISPHKGKVYTARGCTEVCRVYVCLLVEGKPLLGKGKVIGEQY